MKLDGKVCVITGSANGIGEAFARRFTAEGAKVVVTDVDAAGVERVAGELGTVGLAVDITVEDNVRAVADLARRTYGDVDIWFSNAGVNEVTPPDLIPDDPTWMLAWNLHVMSHVYAARAVLPSMLERGSGYLLQTASVVAFAMQKDKGPYTVSKHAALALGEWLAANYRPRGVKVSVFCPGAMRTRMLAAAMPPDHPMVLAAATLEEVAERLVAGIDAEKFLILDSDIAIQSMSLKISDYEQWMGWMESI